MGKKKRMPIHLKAYEVRYKISQWLKQNKNVLFNVPYLCGQIGLKPDSFSDRNKVYGAIVYWRTKFISFYNKWKKAGKLKDMDRYQAWDIMLFNYNQNDAYVFLSKFDKKTKASYFIQPGFNELENMDRSRIEKQWKGIGTIINEMQIEDARLVLPDGSREPIDKLLKAGKSFDKLLPRSDLNE